MTVKHLFFQVWGLLLLLILGALPLAVSSVIGKVHVRLMEIPEVVLPFLKGLFNGSSFYYLEGERVRFFFSDVGKYFVTSFLYLLVAGLLAIVLSVIFGIWDWRRSEKGLHSFVGVVGVLPDFILVFLMQLLIIFIYEHTGLKVARVASPNMDHPSIALPLLTLFILPFFYLVRSLSEKTYDVLTEDYIRTALSKGLRKRHIYLYHVTPNVIPYLKADLHKVVSIMIGNLFIVEYLYNNKGLTSMLFPMRIDYQYNLYILCFLSFYILYITVYFTLKAAVIIMERIVKNERTI